MSGLLRALLLGLALAGPAASIANASERPSILLAEIYRGQVDVTRYLISEKLDGVRALWDGKNLKFRSGRQIHAPRWFLDGLPEQALDGELWIARGGFERLSGIVRRDIPVDAEWEHVRYMIFELPDAPGSFRERSEAIQTIVRQTNSPWLQAIDQLQMDNEDSLQELFVETTAAGAEGLMLHLAEARYETGRSDVLLKMKPWQDAEAVVVGHRPGKGKYQGRLGALAVRTPEGLELLLGSGFSDDLRTNPPPLGTTVT